MQATTRTIRAVGALGMAAALLVGCGGESDGVFSAAGADRSSTSAASSAPPTTGERIGTPTPRTDASDLLVVTDLKDGDSWDASDGQEYRLGLVNAPERNEQCGTAARDFTAAFLADGFTADVYADDQYGRVVAEVFDAEGASLNVALAASGLGDGRYIDEFRAENPDLARRIETALDGAPVASCASPPVLTTPPAPVRDAPAATTPQPLVAPTPTQPPATQPPATQPPPTNPPPTNPPPSGGACHPAYSPCVPIKGDGSGRGGANDLDCGDIGFAITRTGGADPYRFDADGDGRGCESYG